MLTPPGPPAALTLEARTVKHMERSERLKLIVIKGADEGKQFELSDAIVGRKRRTPAVPARVLRLVGGVEPSGARPSLFLGPAGSR